MSPKEAKAKGYKIVILNGFEEHVNYVISLSDVKYVGETKSSDGYSMIPCYES